MDAQPAAGMVGLEGAPAPAAAAEQGPEATTIYALAGGAALVAILVIGYAIVAIMPDGTSAANSAAFYRDHQALIKLAAFGAALGAVGVIWQSGAIAARLWSADRSPRHVLSWIALASDLVLFAVFFLEVGLFAATALLVDHVSDEIIHALHVSAFTSAYIMGAIWIPYFVCVALIGRRSGIMPRWLTRLALATCVTNSFAIGAMFSLSGPFNGQNGIVALGGATFLPIAWLSLSAAWLVVQGRAESRTQAEAVAG